MSYILAAIKKEECQRETNQFVDYSDNKQIFNKKTFIIITLVLNVIIWSALLWPKESLEPPQIIITSPLLSQQP
ncbi:hypothetical protein QUF50_10745 [Thiotrichales bacterium HSG1]|nr:hypothetical protein [Thiotrichales bacterium HSG1]